MKNRKLLTLIIHDTEAPLYTNEIFPALNIPPIEVKYGMQWIIKYYILYLGFKIIYNPVIFGLYLRLHGRSLTVRVCGCISYL